MNSGGLSSDCLRIDAAKVAERISTSIKDSVFGELRRQGAVLGLSGGVDSSVVAALCVRSLGADRVLGVFMPERDSEPASLRLGRMVAEQLRIATVLEDLTPMLDAMGCYRRRDEFIRQVFPEYGPGWKNKIVLTGAQAASYNLFALVVESPDGEQKRARLPLSAYLGIVASTNMKQRTRKQIEYFHADRLNYVVVGTPNRQEYDLGFFVKNGDGAADLKPIAHLYKGQVYQLAEFLGIPEEIRRRPPTTDTYSLPQTQEEFFFTLPYDKMDLCLYSLNNGIAASDAAVVTGLTTAQVERVYKDINSKRRATRYQHLQPLLVEGLE
jgi:NAD+ synthase